MQDRSIPARTNPMEVQLPKASPPEEAAKQGRLNRREYPRHPVDCSVTLCPIAGASQFPGRLVELSAGGCRIETESHFLAGMLVRVEVRFHLRGIAFLLSGVTVGSRGNKTVAIRFLKMPQRRKDELDEVIGEIAQVNATKSVVGETPLPQAEHIDWKTRKTAKQSLLDLVGAAPPTLLFPTLKVFPAPKVAVSAPAPVAIEDSLAPSELAVAATPLRPSQDRRANVRLDVDTRAKLLLVNSGISMPGRILDLSLAGCRIRTDERFNVGIYVRVEAEFYLHGLPFRLGGVSQAIIDKYTIGARFLDVSDRKRLQMQELIAEIAEASAQAAEHAAKL